MEGGCGESHNSGGEGGEGGKGVAILPKETACAARGRQSGVGVWRINQRSVIGTRLGRAEGRDVRSGSNVCATTWPGAATPAR